MHAAKTLAMAAAVLSCSAWALCDEPVKPVRQEMAGVGIEEKPGAVLPLDAAFKDQDGQAVRLGDYFNDGKPVVLNLVYYECPGICTAVLSGLTATLREVDWTAGNQFRVVTISFNPKDTPSLAQAKRANYLQTLGRPVPQDGWSFLTGDEANIRKVAQAVGFKYRWIEETGQYAHDMAQVLATGQGRVSRYLRGAYYDPKTFRLALVEASGGKIGTISDKVWLQVCGYDASQGKYVVMARTILAAGGALTVLAMLAVLVPVWLKEKRRFKQHAASKDATLHPA